MKAELRFDRRGSPNRRTTEKTKSGEKYKKWGRKDSLLRETPRQKTKAVKKMGGSPARVETG